MPSDPIEQKYSSSHFMSLQAVLAYTALAIFVYLLHLGGYTSYISWPMSYYYPDQLTGEEWLWAALVGLFVAAACVLVPLVLKEADGYTQSIEPAFEAVRKAGLPFHILWLCPVLIGLGMKPDMAWFFFYLGLVAVALLMLGYHLPLGEGRRGEGESAEAGRGGEEESWGEESGEEEKKTESVASVPLALKLVLAGGVGAFILFFSYQTILQYHAGNYGYADSGFVAEALWNTLHGRFMYAHNFVPPMLLADHLSPIWLTLLPFYAIFPRHETLIVASAVSLGMTAVPLFLLARWEWRSNGYALCFGLAFLLFPAAQHEVCSFSFGFQAEVMAIPFLAWACYCMRREWWKRFWLFVLLVLCCKETLAAVVLGMGLCVFSVQKNRKQGVAVAVLAVVWILASTKLVLPWLKAAWPSDEVLNSKGSDQYYQLQHFFGQFGDGYTEIVFNILTMLFTSPVETVGKFLHREVWIFSCQMLLPLCLLSLLSPAALLLGAAHGFLMLVCFDRPHFFSIFQHYKIALVIVPFWAAAIGVRQLAEGQSWIQRLARWKRPNRLSNAILSIDSRKAVIRAAGISILISSVIHCYYFGPTPLSRTYVPRLYDTSTPRAQALARMKKLIPMDASIVTTHRAAAHFTDRKQLYCIPLSHRKDP
ncbi:MAG: DUF2079 domain-containing protein, partial [Planctomycetota bacterium]|nr:DUF2079 domain-containing protein [Planctomycetota bacterium]